MLHLHVEALSLYLVWKGGGEFGNGKLGEEQVQTTAKKRSLLYSVMFHDNYYVHDNLLILSCKEPVFVDLLRSPGIDSQPGGPVR